MQRLVPVACVSFAIGCVVPSLYRWAKGVASSHLNEVRYTCPRAACCVNEVNVNCDNPSCKVRNEKRIVDLINAAKHTVLLAMYIFTSNCQAEAIIAAQERGVRVLMIGCRSMAYSSGSQMVRLSKLSTKINQNVYIHSLAIIKILLQTFLFASRSTRSSSCITNSA